MVVENVQRKCSCFSVPTCSEGDAASLFLTVVVCLCRTFLWLSSSRISPRRWALPLTLRVERDKRPSGNSSPASAFTSWISSWFSKRWPCPFTASQCSTQTHRTTNKSTKPKRNPTPAALCFIYYLPEFFSLEISVGLSVPQNSGFEI